MSYVRIRPIKSKDKDFNFVRVSTYNGKTKMTTDRSYLFSLLRKIKPTIEPSAFKTQEFPLSDKERKIMDLLLEFKDDYEVLREVVENDPRTKTDILDTLEIQLLAREIVETTSRHK